eukprot:TRINITY_DN786_c0_g1_i4.p1 TRINITY_DN786_c0_g1~~TRINITY_DN786_c0_g1_i4.p1  ORF type:complete len:526 (+),score=115.68 TRINITY_DN786_c0_g1_i4:107-1684(+)
MSYMPMPLPTIVVPQNSEDTLCWTPASLPVAGADFSNINLMSNVAYAQNFDFQSLPNIQCHVAGANFSNIDDIGNFAMHAHAATEQERRSAYGPGTGGVAQENSAHYHAPDDALKAMQGSQPKTRRRGGQRRNNGSWSTGALPATVGLQALSSGDATSPENLMRLYTDKDFAEQIIKDLVVEVKDKARLINWMLPELHLLALSAIASPVVQKVIEVASSKKMQEKVVAALEPHVAELSQSPEGKYVLWKLLETCRDFTDKIVQKLEAREDVDLIMNLIRPALLQLSLSPIATHVVQKAIGTADSELQKEMLAELGPHAAELWRSEAANFVLQCLIENVEPARLDDVRKILGEDWETVAKDQCGSRVCERLIEHSEPHRLLSLIAVIETKAVTLCRDQYGNHVVQHLFEHVNVPVVRSRVLKPLLSDPCTLAMHQHANYAMEKAWLHCNETDRRLMAKAFLEAKSPTLEDVAFHKIGRHVVKHLADLSEECDLRNKICGRFYESRFRLGSNEFGRDVLKSFGIPVN